MGGELVSPSRGALTRGVTQRRPTSPAAGPGGATRVPCSRAASMTSARRSRAIMFVPIAARSANAGSSTRTWVPAASSVSTSRASWAADRRRRAAIARSRIPPPLTQALDDIGLTPITASRPAPASRSALE